MDGTLADPNYLHAATWWEAFAQAGYVVPMAEIHRAIGMGSGTMLDKMLPQDRDIRTAMRISARRLGTGMAGSGCA